MRPDREIYGRRGFGVDLTGYGNVNTPDDPAAPLTNNGHIIGQSAARPITPSGYVRGVGTLENVVVAGTDAPGFSPAIVNRGSVRYDGLVQIEMAGSAPGSGHDQINHILGEGIAELGGKLQATLIGPFMPTVSDRLVVITAEGGVVGQFATVQVPSLTDDVGMYVDYGEREVALLATHKADFQEDGDVDAGDLANWQGGFGASRDVTHQEGDADANQTVDGADFLAWQRQYGRSSAPAAVMSGGPTTRIPEPTASSLLTVAFLATAALGNIARRLFPTLTGVTSARREGPQQ